jgi:environmental stress-induced protein Ves
MLAAAARAAAAWKNGGGVTREVAVYPAGSVLGSFEWRVSIAEIHRGGPFSVFAGIDRHLAVLDGQVSLAVEGRTLSLSADSAPLTFGGELPVYAEPTAGPVIDLNLMVRRGRWRAELSRHALPQPGAVTLAADTTILIALTPLRVTVQGKRYALARLDALQLEEVAQCKVQPAATQPGSPAAFYLAGVSRTP